MHILRRAEVDTINADRDADDVEHLLTASLLFELEHELAAEGRLPDITPEVPDSPHELGTDPKNTPSSDF